MLLYHIKDMLKQYRDDERGTIMVETVLTLPMLFWTMCATFEFFEVHRYKSARIKATYTVADMFSREMDVINSVYVDNAKVLFDEISNDGSPNQLRVTVVRYLEVGDQYEVKWSETRGSGSMNPLVTANVATAHDEFPIMADGEEVIVVESISNYTPLFEVGFGSGVNIETRVFTSLRFAPQLCFDACT